MLRLPCLRDGKNLAVPLFRPVLILALSTISLRASNYEIHGLPQGVRIGMSMPDLKKIRPALRKTSPTSYSEIINHTEVTQAEYIFEAPAQRTLLKVIVHYVNGTFVGRRLYQKFGKANFSGSYVLDSGANNFGIFLRANFNKAEYSSTLLPGNTKAHEYWAKQIRKSQSTTAGAQAAASGNICLNAEARKLAQLINQYRTSRGLPAIPVSKKLSNVAHLHVEDLRLNKPDQGPRCNSHSWSSKVTARPCCYTRDHRQAACMWAKPKELAGYDSAGFEIAFGPYGSINAENSLAAWKKSPGHNSVMVNQGLWKNRRWNAMGVGINGQYAVVWFGTLADSEICQ